MSAVSKLVQLLEASKARVTFDPARNVTLPCFCCGETEKPRTLERVGHWSRRVGNRGIAGDEIERPVCAACKDRFPETPSGSPPDRVDAEAVANHLGFLITNPFVAAEDAIVLADAVRILHKLAPSNRSRSGG